MKKDYLFKILLVIVLLALGILNVFMVKKLNETNNKINILENNINKIKEDNSNMDEDIDEEIINIEGIEESIKVKTYNSSLGYSIKYDIDVFKLENKNKCDYFYTSNDEVYFSICEEKSVVIKNTDLYEINGIKYPKDTLITINDDILITKYYIKINNKYLVIETQYPNTSEYIEGFGTRILNTIDSFALNN